MRNRTTVNFARWSTRLPGTQRRTAAAQAGPPAQQPSGRGDSAEGAGAVPGARAERLGRRERLQRHERFGRRDPSGVTTEAKGVAWPSIRPGASTPPTPPGPAGPAGPAGPPAPAGAPSAAGPSVGSDAVAAPAEEHGSGAHLEPATTALSVPADQVARGIDALTVHDLLGKVPGLAAVVQGPEHRVAYVNDAYALVFGPRSPGAPAREALPELIELGLLPLMDQVLRSGKPRTVKSRRVPAASQPADNNAATRTRDSFYTFTCTPIATDGKGGVLVFAADVTDQMEAAERLRASERRQREAAVTLQRSLLPQELEQPDDLRVAATYQPGGTEAAVGGDWYDVITLGAGRTALVIGDVMGRGVRAAAVMGQLRTAVRAYARLDLPPHEVLQLLDGLTSEIDFGQIATCVYAVHDPNEGCLHYASAGHVPVLVRDADGTVQRAAEPTGPPLGTGGWAHTSSSLPFAEGASAVLYTDGLIERRDADIDTGVDTLEHAFAGASGPPDVVCDRLLRSLGITAEHDDDVAVLVCQHPARTGADAELFHNAALDLLGGTEAAPRARAFASGVLSSWRFPRELHDLGVLAASELVANSLQHGTPPMRLRLRRTDRRLIVEVTDGDEHLPRRRRAEPIDEAGRGISIVATIASAWGARKTPGGGKSVWCEFALRCGRHGHKGALT
jgi:anti-sigma regulatory factor (Ser/Thr protein kinase)